MFSVIMQKLNMASIEKKESIQSKKPKIALFCNLDLNKLLDNADKDLEQGRFGNRLILFFKPEEKHPRLAAIDFRLRTRGAPIRGFWMDEGNGTGSTLERSAIIFDPENRTMTIIDPGLENEVNGIKIDHKRRATKFSGPLNSFPQIILDAKTKASDYCKKKDALRK